MNTATKPLLTLTAADLMTRDLLVISEDIPMRRAAELLLSHQISGAPVVDLAGKLVGVISTTDFMRVSRQHESAPNQRPAICSYQTWDRDPGGREMACCSLPEGGC